MFRTVKIALCLPGASDTNRHFSIRLQRHREENPCIYHANRHLFVFAISGSKEQFKSFFRLLIKQQIIDRHLQWTFGEGHLVIFGDSYDEGNPNTNWWWFLYGLEQKARAKGGHVHFLPGPHELIHFNGSWRYEHPSYPKAAAKLRSPITALYDANFELSYWLRSRNIVEKIGNSLFIHQDLLPVLNRQSASLTEINAIPRSNWMSLSKELVTAPSHLPTNGKVFLNRDTNIEIINAIVQQFETDTIITGNNQQNKISIGFNGKLIQTATNYVNGNPSGLLIRRNRFLQVDFKGEQTTIKK